MKSIDTGKDKVRKICEVLKQEALDPARREADEIVAMARSDAKRIIEEAKRKGKGMIEEARKKTEEEYNVFKASVNLACKKSFDTLKQRVEHNLFNTQLAAFIDGPMNDPHVLAKIISAMIKGIEDRGDRADLEAVISSAVSPKEVSRELVRGVVDRLRSGGVEIGDIAGGVQIKIVDENLTLDMTDETLKALLAEFVREDFREAIFAETGQEQG